MKQQRSLLNAEKTAVTQLRAEKDKSNARFEKFRQQFERRSEKLTKHHDEVVANLRTEKVRCQLKLSPSSTVSSRVLDLSGTGSWR